MLGPLGYTMIARGSGKLDPCPEKDGGIGKSHSCTFNPMKSLACLCLLLAAARLSGANALVIQTDFGTKDGAVAAMTHKVFEGRVQFHDGDDEIAPGITVHKVGGHTRGMQIVRVATARGWVVLGSDSAHFYANLETDRPFPIFDDLSAYVQAQRTALQLASSPQHFIPGHDPRVLARYPSARAGLEGVARLDLAPGVQHE